MIVDCESQFDQIVFAFSDQFKTKYDQLVEAKNFNQCVMVLVKNVIAIIVDNWSFQTQPYTILSKMVDDSVKAQLLQLHIKLFGHQPLVKEVIYSCCF